MHLYYFVLYHTFLFNISTNKYEMLHARSPSRINLKVSMVAGQGLRALGVYLETDMPSL